MARKNLNDVIYGDRSHSRSSSIYDFDSASFSAKPKGKSYFSGERCYHKHPPLKLPGTDLVIYGGSCSSPAVNDADIYIGFDGSMTFTGKQYPWAKGEEFLFRITDMDAPKNPEEFKKLVSWTKAQLEAGKKVHCGCIGGHGRTGTFLAALCSEFGEKDAIAYVRKNYCHKAVESSTQIDFLKKHFGIKGATGSKSSGSYGKGSKASKFPDDLGVERYKPMAGNGCIWDRSL